MPRFYLPPTQIQGDKFKLTGSEARHAVHVLRKKAGDRIELFDGQDRAFTGEIESVLADALTGKILSSEIRRSSEIELWLYAALIKGPRWDWLLQKACEVGVDVLVPLLTSRTVVQLEGREISAKLARWRRIALEATKQCGRGSAMEVREPQAFVEAFAQVPADSLLLFPWEKESHQTIRQACAEFSGRRACLYIGPEGGWSYEEAEAAQAVGAKPVTLGKNLLRAETAGIVAAALVAQELVKC